MVSEGKVRFEEIRFWCSDIFSHMAWSPGSSHTTLWLAGCLRVLKIIPAGLEEKVVKNDGPITVMTSRCSLILPSCLYSLCRPPPKTFRPIGLGWELYTGSTHRKGWLPVTKVKLEEICLWGGVSYLGEEWLRDWYFIGNSETFYR